MCVGSHFIHFYHHWEGPVLTQSHVLRYLESVHPHTEPCSEVLGVSTSPIESHLQRYLKSVLPQEEA